MKIEFIVHFEMLITEFGYEDVNMPILWHFVMNGPHCILKMFIPFLPSSSGFLIKVLWWLISEPVFKKVTPKPSTLNPFDETEEDSTNPFSEDSVNDSANPFDEPTPPDRVLKSNAKTSKSVSSSEEKYKSNTLPYQKKRKAPPVPQEADKSSGQKSSLNLKLSKSSSAHETIQRPLYEGTPPSSPDEDKPLRRPITPPSVDPSTSESFDTSVGSSLTATPNKR